MPIQIPQNIDKEFYKDISQIVSPRNPKEHLIDEEIAEIYQDVEIDEDLVVQDSSQKDGKK